MLRDHKIFRECVKKQKNGKNRARIGQDRVPPLFCPSLERALYGGYKMEMRHSNARLSIYRMENASAFVIKGDAPYIRNGRCARFRDKRRRVP
jgi:hypothetical protein